MYGPYVVMEPASLWAVDQICHDVEGFRVLEFGVDDIGDGIITKVDLDAIRIRAWKREW